MTVREELGRLGTHIGDFNQGQFRTWDAVEGADLKGGYCAGVVLDWARRVLQSAPDRDQSYLIYSLKKMEEIGDGNESRQSTTARRMAKAYAGQSSSYATGPTELEKSDSCTEVALEATRKENKA